VDAIGVELPIVFCLAWNDYFVAIEFRGQDAYFQPKHSADKTQILAFVEQEDITPWSQKYDS
jgi:hypothetical protein